MEVLIAKYYDFTVNMKLIDKITNNDDDDDNNNNNNNNNDSNNNNDNKTCKKMCKNTSNLSICYPMQFIISWTLSYSEQENQS